MNNSQQTYLDPRKNYFLKVKCLWVQLRGHRGVLLKYLSYKTTEEKSKASSLSSHKKLISDTISRSASLDVNNESKRTSIFEVGTEKIKIYTERDG
ncbi:hypothetical protein KSP40_PGU017346 [Platanthera guangdongensis]|uniref:Uncharacterized protein n=1 Tax=Platanthera guangdongensis TaxID=2320717 RepID=A0ABR2LJQ9_9ASPA